jgi:5-methyltetrahydropteroyltriglutamate--homocysteine methyltransferase
MTTTVRADQIGSFLRPSALLDAIANHRRGDLDTEGLQAAEDAAIGEILEVQRAAGVDIYSDGEYRRSWFASAWGDCVAGLVEAPHRDLIAMEWDGPTRDLAGAALEIPQMTHVVGAPISATRSFTAHEASFLADHAPGPYKITLPGITQQALQWFRPGITDAHYATLGELADAMAGLLADEVTDLVAAGVSFVQLDSLVYVVQYGDERYRADLLANGVDPEQLLADTIRSDNASLAPAREAEGTSVGVHMCRGNNRSAWSAAGGYDPIAERAFSELDVDRFLLEYDSDRAGGFEPLRFVPPGKVVALGLVSTKVPQLESQDDLLRRIEEASRYLPVEQLALSPQCGFASVLEGNMLGWDDQRRKLELVADTARKVWG